MSNNSAIRRLLAVFQASDGTPAPGAPGGPVLGVRIGAAFRHVATGPNPTLAYLLVPADDNMIGGMLRNLDAALTVYYGSDPTITEVTGCTLNAGESVPINIRGPIYIYTLSGAPICEFAPAYRV